VGSYRMTQAKRPGPASDPVGVTEDGQLEFLTVTAWSR